MSGSLFLSTNLTMPRYSLKIPVSVINIQICQLLICSLKGIIRKIILAGLPLYNPPVWQYHVTLYLPEKKSW